MEERELLSAVPFGPEQFISTSAHSAYSAVAADVSGVVNITVRATDPDFLFAQDTFQVTVTPNQAPALPFTVQGPGVDPSDFRVTTFASGLNNPLSMQSLPDGSLVVTTWDGELLRFVDADNNGVADGAGQVMYSGLPGLTTSVRFAGDLVLVHAVGGDLTVLRQGATPSDAFTLIGTVDFDYTNRPGEHVSHSLGVHPTVGQPGKYDVYTNLGAQANFAATPLDQTVTLNGLGFNNATMLSDSVNMLRLDNTGAAPVFESVTQIVDGVRNPAGFIFDPATGDMYFSENGIDTPGNRGESFSADELNFLAAADIGGTVEHFGFPNRYTEYRTGNTIDDGSGPPGMIDPLVAFTPIPLPATGAESEGPNEIAFAPELFPSGLNDGIFVTFHGVSGQEGVSNEENPLVYVDLNTLEYFHFISNTEPLIGHLDGVLATSNSLFLTDLQGNGAGVIYQVQVVAAANDAPQVVLPIADLTVSENALPVLNHADLNAVFDDPDNPDSELVYTIVANTPEGVVTAVIEPDDTLDLSFVADTTGVVDITVRATDPDLLFADDTFQVTVISSQSPRVALPIADLTVPENALPRLNYANLNAVFSDPDNSDSELVYSIVANTPAGIVTAVIEPNDTLDLSFVTGASGVVTLTVRATDPDMLFADDTFQVTVTPNQSPVVVLPIADLTVSENALPVLNHADLLAVFEDPDNSDSELVYSIVANTPAGIVAVLIEPDGTLDLSFVTDASGVVTVTVRATDPNLLFADDTFQVTVTSNLSPRVALPIADLTVPENAPPRLNYANLNAVFSDPDHSDSALVYTIEANTPAGIVTAVIEPNDTLDLSFVTAASGVVEITVRATDPDLLFADDMFQVTVTPNQPPVVVLPIANLTVSENSPPVLNHADLNAVFDDPDNLDSELVYSIVANTPAGIVTAAIEPDDTLDLSFVTDVTGVANITVRATDPDLQFADGTFRVTVISNQPPRVALPIADLTVPENASPRLNYANLNAVFSDPDNSDSALVYSIVVNTPAGIVTTVIQPNDTLDLSFVTAAAGVVNITVRATDPDLLFADDTFQVTVTPNQPPVVALPIADLTVSENALPVLNHANLLAVFDDPDNSDSELVYSIVANTPAGIVTVLIEPNGTLDLSFVADVTGVATVTVRATDPGLRFANDTFQVTVTSNQTPQVVLPIADLTVPKNASPRLNYANLNAVFSDPDNADSELIYSIVANTPAGIVTAVIEPNDTLDLSFVAGASGVVNITVQATDPDLLFATDTFQVTVTPNNTSQTVGLFAPVSSTFFLKNSNTPGVADSIVRFGPSGLSWLPVVGDWDGNDTTTLGLFAPVSSTFFLKNSNTPGVADSIVRFGPSGSGWLPVVGDWDGDDTTTLGLFDPVSSTFFLKNSNTPGVADSIVRFGPSGLSWLPVVGDWDGNGTTTLGLFNPVSSTFFLKNSNTPGVADSIVRFGPSGSGWLPVVGDWDGNGTTTIGLFNPVSSTFFLKNSNESGVAQEIFRFGPVNVGWIPLAGNWNGTSASATSTMLAAMTGQLLDLEADKQPGFTGAQGTSRIGTRTVVSEWAAALLDSRSSRDAWESEDDVDATSLAAPLPSSTPRSSSSEDMESVLRGTDDTESVEEAFSEFDPSLLHEFLLEELAVALVG